MKYDVDVLFMVWYIPGSWLRVCRIRSLFYNKHLKDTAYGDGLNSLRTGKKNYWKTEEILKEYSVHGSITREADLNILLSIHSIHHKEFV